MTEVEKFLNSCDFNRWYLCTPEQVEKLKPFARAFDLTFWPDFSKFKKEYQEQHFTNMRKLLAK